MTPIEPKPLLRWAGSKRQLVGCLKAYWNDSYLRYVEPFAGSASLFFSIRPQRAVLADLNAELIEAYDVLRKWPRKLYQSISMIPRGKSTYYQLRKINPRRLSSFERTVRFLYLNRFCFNGIYRTNLAGQFNVPYASAGTGDFPSLKQFCVSAELLSRAELRPWDFGTTLRYVRPGDFVYIDPPYAIETRRVFCEYGPKTFSKMDLRRLSTHLERIHSRGARFLVSYADCSEARAIFGRWNIRRITVRRNIAGFSRARKSSREIIATNVET